MLKSRLCDYCDAYILVSGAITVIGTGHMLQQQPQTKIINKQYLKNCAPLTNCMTKINNMQVENAKELDVIMSIHNKQNMVIITKTYGEVYINFIEMSQ